MADFGEYNILFDDDSVETPHPTTQPKSVDYGEYNVLFDEPTTQPVATDRGFGEYDVLFDEEPQIQPQQTYQDAEGNKYDTKEELFGVLQSNIDNAIVPEAKAHKFVGPIAAPALEAVKGPLRFLKQYGSIAEDDLRADLKSQEDRFVVSKNEKEKKALSRVIKTTRAKLGIHKGITKNIAKAQESELLEALPFDAAETKGGRLFQALEGGGVTLFQAMLPGGAASIGASVASETFDDLVENGVDKKKSFVVGGINGAVQGAFEHLGGALIKNAGKIAIKGGKAALQTLAVTAAKAGSGESIEEFFQQYTDIIAKAAGKAKSGELMGDIMSEVFTGVNALKNLKDAAYSSLVGFILGAGSSAAIGTSSIQQNNKLKKGIKDISPQLSTEEVENVAEYIKENAPSIDAIKDRIGNILKDKGISETPTNINQDDQSLNVNEEFLAEMTDEQIEEQWAKGLDELKATPELNDGFVDYLQEKGIKNVENGKEGLLVLQEYLNIAKDITKEETAQVTEQVTAQVETPQVEPTQFAEDFSNVNTFNKAVQDNLDDGNTSTVKALMRNLTPEEHTELKTLRETSKQQPIEEVTQDAIPEVVTEVTEDVKPVEETSKKVKEKPDAATENFEEFDEWERGRIKELTNGMSEVERADWVLAGNGAKLRAEFDALKETEAKVEEKPTEKKPKKRVKVKLKEKTPTIQKTEPSRKSTTTKINALKTIRDDLVVFDSKKHKTLVSEGFAEKLSSTDKKTGKTTTYITLTDEGSDRIGSLETGFNRGQVKLESLKTIDEDLQQVAGFDTNLIDPGFKNFIEADNMEVIKR